jgi:ABC-type multidrug transport system fused ATPase/permease subunit
MEHNLLDYILDVIAIVFLLGITAVSFKISTKLGLCVTLLIIVLTIAESIKSYKSKQARKEILSDLYSHNK